MAERPREQRLHLASTGRYATTGAATTRTTPTPEVTNTYRRQRLRGPCVGERARGTAERQIMKGRIR